MYFDQEHNDMLLLTRTILQDIISELTRQNNTKQDNIMISCLFYVILIFSEQ